MTDMQQQPIAESPVPSTEAWKSIPGWFDFQFHYDWILDLVDNGDVFVEVGSFLGKSLAFFVENARKRGKELKVFSVDTFRITPDDDGGGSMPWGQNGKEWEAQQRAGGEPEPLLRCFLENISHAPGSEMVKHIQADSVSAARQFQDRSVKAVFLDASHLYKNVLSDLGAWLPKLRGDGVIGGHDYQSPEVRKAIHDFFPYETDVYVKGNSWLMFLGPRRYFNYGVALNFKVLGHDERYVRQAVHGRMNEVLRGLDSEDMKFDSCSWTNP